MKLKVLRFEFKLQDMWWGVFWRIGYEADKRYLHVWWCFIPCLPLYSLWHLT